MIDKKKRGRPPVYDQQEIKRKICELIAEGASMLEVTRMDGMPSRPVILSWLREDSAFQADYARAREDRADVMFEDLDEVSEAAATAETAVEVAGLRLKADNIKWKLARMNAKKYGEKSQVEHSGQVELTLEQVEERIARLTAQRNV